MIKDVLVKVNTIHNRISVDSASCVDGVRVMTLNPRWFSLTRRRMPVVQRWFGVMCWHRRRSDVDSTSIQCWYGVIGLHKLERSKSVIKMYKLWPVKNHSIVCKHVHTCMFVSYYLYIRISIFVDNCVDYNPNFPFL